MGSGGRESCASCVHSDNGRVCVMDERGRKRKERENIEKKKGGAIYTPITFIHFF